MDRDKVIKGLECCFVKRSCWTAGCPYYRRNAICNIEVGKDALALLKELSAFKDYFRSLYGEGLEVVNWHLNGATEPFDNFYESAIKESGVNDGQG